MTRGDVERWVETRKLEVVLALVSMMAIGVGVFWWRTAGDGETKVEVLSATSSASSLAVGQLMVDVEGAVARPGVYKMGEGDRVGDALEKAGGLTDQADRGGGEANLNKAAKVTDGMKVYVPRRNEENVQSSVSNVQSSKVSINVASQAELESLPGVGPVTAGKIIAGRPFGDVGELVSKKIVGQKVFGQIKDLISLW